MFGHSLLFVFTSTSNSTFKHAQQGSRDLG
jgi:hypothetical protein